MPTKVYWYLPGKILVNEHIGVLSLEGLTKTIEVTLEMAKSVEDKFYIIADATQITRTPSNIGEIAKASEGLIEMPKLQEILVLSGNPLYKFIGNVVVQLLRKNAKLVDSFEDALARIQKLEMNLSPLSEIKPNMDDAVIVE